MNAVQQSASEQAANWYLRLTDCAPVEKAALQAEFQKWLDADVGNVEVFARVSATWDDIGRHAAAPEMMALRQSALEDVRGAAAVRYRMSPRAWRFIAAAAALAVMILSGVWVVSQKLSSGVAYATSVGERRTIALPDGSQVDIDAKSEIQVQFGREIRLVRLDHGRAFFQVAKDSTRPFIVEAAGRQVVATGTAFDVELMDRRMQVNLVEGHVVVRSAAPVEPYEPLAAENTAQLSPGEQLTVVGSHASPLVRQANVANATSWRHGRLVFDDEPLSVAVARVQRYAQVQIVLADDSLKSLKVSGVFNEGDVTAFVGALKRYFAIQSDSSRPSRILLSRTN
jgi:transmembrane sensor